MPDLETAEIGGDLGPGQSSENQPKNSQINSQNSENRWVFRCFGSFPNRVSAVFSALYPRQKSKAKRVLSKSREG